MPLIRPIAICIFHNNGEILVSQGFDHVKGTYFYRPLGGGIEFGEISAQTIVREIREEIGAEVINLHLIGTLENIFTFQGIPSHQIIQVYDGEFVDPPFTSAVRCWHGKQW
ncbi:NUDIX domain-containing protein [Saccharophagus sp. K07]|uniref:NUDIX hydrolase n=1 Tax=Saccharophagus sp. K07 TaxID=2283636 RepID=UPI001CA31A6A